MRTHGGTCALRQHDDHLDALMHVDSVHLKDVTPVWYVMQGSDIVAVIQLEIADTWAYRQEVKNYPDCRVWCHVMFGWAYMETNSIRSSIWKPAIPPEVLLMAKLLEI